ncbi:energy transducer TonB [Mangrovibacterium sp.]|uniref:energy transducer TonB n=1 Tax=Mangrovibacterium sp. TaxID=1961364 RepID=UPI003566F5F7
MKYCLLFTIALTYFCNCNSQDLKKRSNYSHPNLKETYFVLKSNKDVKHGPYTLVLFNDTIQSGYFRNNEKSGVWKYYRHDQTVEYAFDYDSNKIITDTAVTERPPLYSEGWEYFNILKAKYTEYPVEALEAGASGCVYISFDVNEDGTASDFRLEIGAGNILLNNEALRVVKKVASENFWFPGTNSEGEKVKASIASPVRFIIQ